MARSYVVMQRNPHGILSAVCTILRYQWSSWKQRKINEMPEYWRIHENGATLVLTDNRQDIWEYELHDVPHWSGG